MIDVDERRSEFPLLVFTSQALQVTEKTVSIKPCRMGVLGYLLVWAGPPRYTHHRLQNSSNTWA